MLRKILLGLVALLLLIVLLAGGGLVVAHRAIDEERAPLPGSEELARFLDAPAADLPIRLSWIETASQPMPRSAVLDPERDPGPADAPYVLTHPAFVLEWADGRILLVDAGMRREQAIEFGKPTETLGFADGPATPHVETAAALGDGVARVGGIVFTHLHTDHVDGVIALCVARGGTKLPVFMTVAQAERPNYTTKPGVALIDEAGCVSRQVLPDDVALKPLPGFPGVAVIDADGHTPGSEIVLARVATPAGVRVYAFAGDTVNHIDGVRHDVPKPWAYRTLLIPESEERLGELRRFLAALERERGVTVLVSHDQASLLATDLPHVH